MLLIFQSFSLFLFFISCILFNLSFCEHEHTKSGVLLCRKCGHAIVEEHKVIEIKSPLALGYKNATVFGHRGILVQTFRNPEGFTFKVITTSKSNIHQIGEAHSEFSWFPSFAWKIATCPSCKIQLGWTFESTSHGEDEDPKDKYKVPKAYSFAGLILPKLIHESVADSLIIMPKAYQS